jgi:hypothetical protein
MDLKLISDRLPDRMNQIAGPFIEMVSRHREEKMPAKEREEESA